MSLYGVDLFGGPVTDRVVSHGGRPARVVPYDGMPAYESDTGTLLVMECLIVFATGRRPPMCLPRSYKMACLRAPGGLTALHDDPAAMWQWRPLLYDLKIAFTQRRGSQQELEWRVGLYEVELQKADIDDESLRIVNECAETGVPWEEYKARIKAITDGWQAAHPLPFAEANRRASVILREHLCPQQRLDLEADGAFYVRGTINRLYRVEPGNGCQIVHPETRHQLITLCLHPDEWIPHDDVALATKLLIDSGPDGEQEMLEGARPRLTGMHARPSRRERRAWEIERHLLPVPVEA